MNQANMLLHYVISHYLIVFIPTMAYAKKTGLYSMSAPRRLKSPENRKTTEHRIWLTFHQIKEINRFIQNNKLYRAPLDRLSLDRVSLLTRKQCWDLKIHWNTLRLRWNLSTMCLVLNISVIGLPLILCGCLSKSPSIERPSKLSSLNATWWQSKSALL